MNILAHLNYYPFGMLLPNRHESSNAYRYGFNGMGKDDEVSGEANSYDFGARMYNPRVGRFLSNDPIIQPHQSTYLYAANNPIYFIDLNGQDNIIYMVLIPSKDPKLSKIDANKIAKEANLMYKELGLKTTVKVFDENSRGQFNESYMDKTDSYAVIGSNEQVTERTGLPAATGLENAKSHGNVIGVNINVGDEYSSLPFTSDNQMFAFAIVHGSGHNAEPLSSDIHGFKTDVDLDEDYVNFMSEGAVTAALFDKTGNGMYYSTDSEKYKTEPFIHAEDVQENNPSIKTIMDLFDKTRNKTNIANFLERFKDNDHKDNYERNKATSVSDKQPNNGGSSSSW